VGLTIKELATLYEAYSEGRDPSLPDLPIQYVDFAHWQRTSMSSQVLERQLDYWREKLKGPVPALELPARGPRPVRYSAHGAMHVWRMSRELSEGAKALSRREGVTLFMTLIAAYKTLLYRYTGERDVLVGTPAAGRNRREVEGLIGVFINTLVLRTDLSGEPTFRELLSRVKEVSLEAFANQGVPFEKLVEELQPERDLSRNPFFQVMFVLQNAPMPALKMANVVIRRLDIETETSKFDMTFAMMEEEDGIVSGWLEYNTDLFDEAMIDQMIRHYKNILIGVIAHPDQNLSRIPLLDQAERAQALASSPSAPAPRPFAPCSSCLHYQFEAQVTAAPLAIALVCDNAALSYYELNRRANRLAHLLRSRGVGPQTLVGLFIDRSLDLVIGLLAILKAGGAYLPLDPAYPPDRLAFVLDDARLAVLLTESRMMGALPRSSAEVICLDSDRPLIDSQDDSDPPRVCAEDDPAYVIYTSGSTGKPKGVVVTHANVRRLFESTDGWFNFDHRDVWTLFHSYAFDFSVWEMWGALLYGGRLVIVPYFVSREPQAFYELLVEQGVTVLNQTPSAFRHLMAVDARSARRRELGLRTVIFGGEALELQSLRPWYEGRSDERPELVNMYGITETTVHVTYRPLRKGDTAEGRGSLIGKAIPDLRVYVLDKENEPAPVGVAGEMYVGGAGVSRGYLSRPELTAERFIPDPYGEGSGERLYKTGDVARRTRDGDLEYLGRKDQQVKIRGFRIELGEVESALYEHRGVKEAVAVAREVGGEKQLVAYVVCEGEEPSASELRKMLKEKLPEHMVPGAIVMLERMPLTENGKLDRRALPDPCLDRDDLEQEYQAPRTEVEYTLASIFSEILGVAKIGVNDNFFELGGHSLLAIQALTRIVENFKVEIPLKRLFEAPTVGGLADAVSERQGGEVERVNPITRINRPVDETLLANLDQLTDQQVEALLSRFIAEEEREK
jgi:amino acid adenylation domain-containing protein